MECWREQVDEDGEEGIFVQNVTMIVLYNVYSYLILRCFKMDKTGVINMSIALLQVSAVL